MACEGYNCSSLMGNWFEERQAEKQISKKEPDARILREDNDILFKNSNGIKPLAKIKRKPKWNTKPVIVDHGFRNYTPLSRESYRRNLLDNYYKNKDLRPTKKTSSSAAKAERTSENMQTHGSKIYKMLDKSNAHHKFLTRNYPMNSSNFKSTLKKHNEDHKRFFSMTQYRESYTNGDLNQSKRRKKRGSVTRHAGVSTENRRMKGKKKITFMIGESYRDYQDPQQNIHCQRSWIYGKEKALDVVESKLNRTLASIGGKGKRKTAMNTLLSNMFKRNVGDLPNSLPIEDGEKKFFPSLRHRGAHRRIRSDVTRVMNKGLTYK